MTNSPQEKTKPDKVENFETPFNQGSPWPVLTIDYELYGKALDNCDLSDEQKREFIETLWSVIVSFVDLGFGVHPLQQAVQGCEQIEITKEVSLSAHYDMVELDHQSKTDFRNAADGDSSPSRGRIR